MLFNIEHDFGDRIVGYLVPDGFGSLCRVRLCLRGEIVSIFETNEDRPALVSGGRHENGRCGFSIDDRDIPNLSMQDSLEIYDDETGCLIYRRQQPYMIDKKIIRFETQLMPLWRLDDCLIPYFQYVGKGIDRYGRETVTQMMMLEHVRSLFVSGRLNFKNFSYYIDNGFECFALIQPPHDECAERLLVLRNIAKLGSQFLGMRDAQRFEPAIRFAESLPLEDPKTLHWTLADMPADVASLLANPLLRQLTTNNPDDMPGTGAIASALDVLSGFSVLGLRDQISQFNLAIGEWLEIESDPFPTLPPFQTLSPLGEFLRQTKAVDVILEYDLELYAHIVEARKSIDG
jgi:hypothetical protein